MGKIPSKKVFFSSTIKDLVQYREEAAKIIKELNNDYNNRFLLSEVSMDTEFQDGERISPVERSKKWVDESDWFILIVAWNYGYTQPDQEYSVTECEYRYAVEKSKPCFIFLAGESSDGNKKYIPKGQEDVNLSDCKERDFQSEEDANRLKQFKNDLRTKSFDIFSDLGHFLKLLKGSLKTKIESELSSKPNTDAFHDTQLLIALNLLMEQIESCIKEVKLLANLKRIHDLLHKIRQLGIRRWREEVGTQWNSGGELSGEAKITYLSGLLKVSEYRSEIEGYLQQIPDVAASLKEQIRMVHDTDFKGNQDKKTDFEKTTNLFADRVQRAFTATNYVMLERANKMQYCQLFNSSKQIAKPVLRFKDEDFLTQKIQVLNTEHSALQDVFFQHDNWQRMHNLLERMDKTKGSDIFSDDLDNFLDSRGDMDHLLAQANQLSNQSGILDKWQGKIEAVKHNLEDLSNDKTEATYERMRKAFDDLFFEVDVVTMDKVKHSEECANQNFLDLKKMQNQVQARITTTTHLDT